MSKTWMRMRRSLILLSMGGATLGVFSLGDGASCYALFSDYTTLYQSMGDAAIKTTSDGVFGNIAPDDEQKNIDTIVRTPVTTFVQALWNNWVGSHIADDLPNNPIVKR